MSHEDGSTNCSSSSRRRPTKARFNIGAMTPLGGSAPGSDDDSPLSTPTIAESYSHMKRNLSMKTLRELELRELQEVVWRKGGRSNPFERRHRPRDLDELVPFTVSAAFRSFMLGCGLRAGINIVMLLLQFKRLKGKRAGNIILRALFGPDTLRLGSMLGGFTFLYKWTLHCLRLYNVGPRGRGQTEAWHAALAGAISGLSVWAEKPSRRITIGQQLFCRGLQGNYNSLKSKGHVNIPHGEILLFGFACGQIMYAYMFAQDSLAPAYNTWISRAGGVSKQSALVNCQVAKTGRYLPSAVESLLEGASPINSTILSGYIERGKQGDFGIPMAPCAVIHNPFDGCNEAIINRLIHCFRFMVPVYGALHFIPPILFRYKLFVKFPARSIVRASIGTIRSSLFLAVFVGIFQAVTCSQRNIISLFKNKSPKWLFDVVIHPYVSWFAGFMTCLSLFFEEKRRRSELAMYCLPRALESIWSIARRRSYVPFVPGGEIVLTSVGMSMVMYIYENDPKMLSGIVKSIIWQFIGHG